MQIVFSFNALLLQFLSDALYKSPVDKMVKMMVDNDVPTYMYVLNTTINALNYPYWSRVPHNIEYYFLTGAPFLDPGMDNYSLLFLAYLYNCFHVLIESRPAIQLLYITCLYCVLLFGCYYSSVQDSKGIYGNGSTVVVYIR